ncbi:MAG: hypothetical protein Q4D38_12915 [Planctomycetia bacterium]|nr:hypothetical protein [Planctomycetia bacterium]
MMKNCPILYAEIRALILALLFSLPTSAQFFDAEKSNAAMDAKIAIDWRIQDENPEPINLDAKIEEATIENALSDLRKIAQRLGISLEEVEAERKNLGAGDGERREFYEKVCRMRREARLRESNLRGKSIVFTKHFLLGGSHYAYTEGQSDAQAERQFSKGSALCLLDVTPEGKVVQRNLISDPNGVIRDPAVTFDGKKIIFAWKRSDRLDDYHLYEYDLETSKTRQLTFGLGVADYEPCPLPNGEIVFNSTRCVQVVDCWWTEVSNLYRCDKDGGYLRRVSFDQVHTNYPTLMSDGRIIYTRWDYNDRGQIYPQGLFQMNTDGTAQTECYGNNSWFPTTILHARGIPQSHKILTVLTGHHTRQKGKLAIIDTTKGRQENEGVQIIAPIQETKADRIDAWGQWGDQFQYPYPLSEKDFLVAYSPDGKMRFALYYMDVDGNRELLAADDRTDCGQPFVVEERTPPQERPSSVDESVDYGVYYVQDVFFGPGLEGVDRGRAKKLRVIGLDFRSVGIGSNGNSGPAGGAMASTPVSVGEGTWDAKILLGETEIYPDGSACFKAPARQPLYFQVIDEKGHCIQTMRSWSTLQPGERFSCLGCHEDKNTGTMLRPGIAEAMQRGPQELAPIYGPPRGFSFEKEIQPILDKHCIQCHDNRHKAPPFATGDLAKWGEEQAKTHPAETNPRPFSLLNEKNVDAAAKRQWSDSYLNLVNAMRKDRTSARQTRVVNWIDIQESPALLPPYHAGAAKSALLAMFDCEKPHNDVKLSREELDKIALWIDLLIPFCGDYEENNAWDDVDWQKYHYYMAKKRAQATLSEANYTRWMEYTSSGTAYDFAPALAVENTYRALNSEATLEGDRLNFSGRVSIDQLAIRVTNQGDDAPKEVVVEFSTGFRHSQKYASSAETRWVPLPTQDVEWVKITTPEGCEVELWGIATPPFKLDAECWRPY